MTLPAVANTNRDLAVLVIDDDAFIRMAVAKALNGLNVATIYEAGNGRDAIATLRSVGRDVDLIICDLQMPEVDGIQTMEALAELGTRAGIVIQSAHQEQALNAASEFARAHSLNLLGALTKPVKRDALNAIIDKLWDSGVPTGTTARPIAGVTREELAAGIRSGQLTVHYQPKVAVADRRPVGVEALVRWNHPKYGLLGPGAFVPLAEQENLIGDMTKAVIDTAFRECGGLIRAGLIDTVAINLSAAALRDRSLTEYITAMVEKRDLRPDNVILEVTENMVIDDIRAALHILSRLHLKGFKLSIDDFGTGYSGLQQLLRIPFDELKVDRLFVFDAHNNTVQRTILESTVDLAHRLNMVTTAEGVETKQDWDLLTRLGTKQTQGFYIRKPAALPDVATWLREQAGNRPPA